MCKDTDFTFKEHSLWPMNSNLGGFAQWACAQASRFQNTTASRVLSITQKAFSFYLYSPNFQSLPHFPLQELLVVPPTASCFLCYAILFMLFPLTAFPSFHSFPKLSSKWLQFILQCSVQTGIFSSGKFPLKSLRPGDSSFSTTVKVSYFCSQHTFLRFQQGFPRVLDMMISVHDLWRQLGGNLQQEENQAKYYWISCN